MTYLKANAVFEGGGVKGVGLVGALLAAEEAGYKWENVAGTSAGAIVASLIAVGYNALEIKDIMMNLDLASLNDKTFLSKIPYAGPTLSAANLKGVYKGNAILNWLKEQYKKKGIQKFGDIKTGYNEEEYKYKLRVIASDISRKKLLVLPQDIKKYGIDPDDLDIAFAVRMSISIPLYYKPVIIRYKEGNKSCKSIIVDGGILSNFPVWLFDGKDIPSCPTFGFRLIEPCKNSNVEEMDTAHYLLNIISTMMEAFDERYIEENDFKRTIAIPTVGVGITEFRISKEKKDKLFDSGYVAAKNFLSEWDFSQYIKKYRMNKQRQYLQMKNFNKYYCI